VILNLTKNAVEALPKGKGGHIEVETFRAGDEVVLQVRDNGIGIPEHNHSRIFTPFFTTNVEAGRGLGLATCRTIVEAHGGRISVASTEGEGSTFTIRLPLAPARDEKLSGTQPPSSCAAGHQSGD
jgi:signal transduction histidine kinase